MELWTRGHIATEIQVKRYAAIGVENDGLIVAWFAKATNKLGIWNLIVLRILA